MIYSHSRLQTYQNCPFRFKLRYLDHIKRAEAEGIEAFVGKRVHEVLQKLYEEAWLTKTNTLGDLMNYYDLLWKENWHDNITIVRRKYNKEHYYQFGRKCVENYFQRYQPFDQAVTIGTEMAVNFDLDEAGKYKITGYIDRVAHLDGIYEAHDYKTGASLPSQQSLDTDRQLAFYQIAIQERWPEAKEVRLIWHYLAFDLDLVSKRGHAELEQLKTNTITLINTIEAAKEFPAIESGLCNWCEYPDLCPKRKHFYIVENLGEKDYFKDRGVDLANKYAQLTVEKEKIGEKIKVIKEQIVQYARKENIEIIKGNDHQVRVKITPRLKFPDQETLERAALDKLLQDEGKWLEVSDLNTALLSKTCKQNSWDGALLDKIREFTAEEETVSVYLSPLDEYEKD
ncbi:MAG: PD-(D/E)XK nuclease family protein [Elusimicrobia bacterium]|nr:PD-(D/E)XK nuclease family protein [Elusimicrobiota bacterium]